MWRWPRNIVCGVAACSAFSYLEEQRVERISKRPETYTGQIAKIIRDKDWESFDKEVMNTRVNGSGFRWYTIVTLMARDLRAVYRFHTFNHRKGLAPVDKDEAKNLLYWGVFLKDPDIVGCYVKHVDKQEKNSYFRSMIRDIDISSGVVSEQDAKILKSFCAAGAGLSSIPESPTDRELNGLLSDGQSFLAHLHKVIEGINDPWLRQDLSRLSKEAILEDLEKKS